jgi:uncharacterized protein (DUF1330 family)
MNTRHGLHRFAFALSLLFAGVGALPANAIAQGSLPVYLIIENAVMDENGYRTEYLPRAQESIKAHGGRYVAAGEAIILEGAAPKGRIVIIRWDTEEQFLAWSHSVDYEAAKKVGEKFAKLNLLIVKAVAEGAIPERR